MKKQLLQDLLKSLEMNLGINAGEVKEAAHLAWEELLNSSKRYGQKR